MVVLGFISHGEGNPYRKKELQHETLREEVFTTKARPFAYNWVGDPLNQVDKHEEQHGHETSAKKLKLIKCHIL